MFEKMCERERMGLDHNGIQQIGQQVTFNNGLASLEKCVVNSKIDLHRDS